uniref:Band 4.1-like protein 3 n=1 Tax=Phallusia mammillata TaxID=59560 RepID=A0A6F9DBF0_9ASCI|nr:band 4.1-like protein 3 [Phallusia mammillata]
MAKVDEGATAPTDGKNAPKKVRACQIYLLNGQEFRCEVPKQANGSVLLKQIYDLLNIVENDYFGLYFRDLSDHKYWLEPNKSIKKQLKNGPWSFYFAVKFYPPDPAQLLEDITRYYMVLQIRDDIVGGRLPCSFVTHSLLGSYVVQSELGDYDRSEMKKNYVSNFSFAPNQTNELEERVMDLHKTHRGQTPEQAELNFLENAKKLPLYGVDLHVAQDSEGVEILVGVSWNGVLVYRDGTQINRFSWPRIVKLSYVRSKFFITLRPLDGEIQLSMIGFKMQNHRAAKCLWKSGVEHHAFFRLVRTDTTPTGRFIRIGSKFRYSGRTQQETRKAVGGNQRRPAPEVRRTHSMRLRSDGSEISPVRAVLKPVAEEETPAVAPELPVKKDRKSTFDTVDIVTTTTVEETVEVKEIVTETSQKRSLSLNSLSSTDEDERKKNEALSDHQKVIHKMKVDEKLEVVEFLTPPHPEKSASRGSLDDLDARLPPKKPPRAAEYRSSSPPQLGAEETDCCQEVVKTVTVETVTVTTETETLPTKQDSPEEKVEESVEESDAKSVSSSSSSSSSKSNDNKEEEAESKATASTCSLSSSDVGIPVPDLADDEDFPPPPPEQDDEIPLLQQDNQSDYNSPASSLPDEDVHPGITTVETRTVRVEEVIIPQDENEVHEVSVVSDENDSIVVNPTEGSVSSLSSATSHDSAEITEPANVYNEPPTVATAAVVVDSYVEEIPEGTTSPPVVQTETKTITYENSSSSLTQKSRDEGGDAEPSSWSEVHTQLISSQIISSETDSTITTTEITKVSRGEVSETHIEKQVVSIGQSDVDHYEAMAEAIRDTQMQNPNLSITKVVVHEERPVENSQQS